MKKYFLGGLMLAWCLVAANAQDPLSKKYGDSISKEILKENLTILASDAMEGRETGKRGQKMAAAFVQANFEDYGLTGPVNGSYYQPVKLYTSIPGDIYVKAGQAKYNNYETIVYYGNKTTNGEESAQLVFVGKGRAEDFDQVNVENKVILVQLQPNENFRKVIALAQERKAKATFVYHSSKEEFKDLAVQFKNYFSGGSMSVDEPGQNPNPGVFFIEPDVAAKLLNSTVDKLKKASDEPAKKNALKKIKPTSIAYNVQYKVDVLKSNNVLGFLEGTDKKDEIVVVTSHYDHIGINKEGEGDRINNGADDDGSGTVAIMEIARVFSEAKKNGNGPRRSILFMAVTGEEKGLLGSDYYTRHPIFPLEKTIVNLNVDMVGRSDPDNEGKDYVYIIGSDKLSSELHELSERVNKTYTNLIYDYTYNDPNHPERLYYRSDHWNFAKNNIPIIFYFDGIHADYHRPSDEVDKIEFDLLTKRTKAIFHTAWEIANRDKTIKPD
jgi:hypothetical protein